MGTRGCVAVGNPNKWIGLYNHWDSYPSGLGADVWEEWKRNSNLPEELLKYDDWRSYLAGGICEYCGKKRGQPHSITVNEHTNRPGGDPDALYHKHNEGNPSEHHITNENPDPLFLEWIYILNKDERKIHILAHVSMKGYKSESARSNRSTGGPFLLENGYWDYGHCAFKHELVYTLSMDDPEPDWSEVTNQAMKQLGYEDD